LETFRFVVHAVPRVAERAREIRFDDAMTPNGAQRCASSGLREPNAAIPLMRDQPLLGEAADHAAHGRGREAQLRGDLVRAGDARRALQLEDALEVILDRRRDRRCRADGGQMGVPAGGVREPSRRSPRTSSTGTRDMWRTSFATLPYKRS